MRKRENSSHTTMLGFWLVGALIAIIALSAYLLSRQAAPPPAHVTGQVVDVISPLPTAAPTTQPVAPAPPAVAACTFKADVSAAPPPQDELRISLSASQAVFSDDEHTLRIGNWSPDGARILLARSALKGQEESIDALVVATHLLQPFVIRNQMSGFPFWDQTGKAVLFEESYRDKDGTIVPLQLVRAAAGDGTRGIAPQRTVIARNLAFAPQATSLNPRDGSITFFLKDAPTQPIAVNPVVGNIETAAVAATAPLPPLSAGALPDKNASFRYPEPYRVAWNPQGTMAAFHNFDGFLLYNAESTRLCAVDIGQVPEQAQTWALEARWSPSGRYLAILKVPGDRPFRHMWLEVLDTFDGTLQTIEAPTDVTTMRWLPSDDRGLIFSQRIPNEQELGIDTLMLADPRSGKTQPLTEGFVFGSLDYFGLEISPDGSLLATRCPVHDIPAETDQNAKPRPANVCLTEIKVLP